MVMTPTKKGNHIPYVKDYGHDDDGGDNGDDTDEKPHTCPAPLPRSSQRLSWIGTVNDILVISSNHKKKIHNTHIYERTENGEAIMKYTQYIHTTYL